MHFGFLLNYDNDKIKQNLNNVLNFIKFTVGHSQNGLHGHCEHHVPRPSGVHLPPTSGGIHQKATQTKFHRVYRVYVMIDADVVISLFLPVCKYLFVLITCLMDAPVPGSLSAHDVAASLFILWSMKVIFSQCHLDPIVQGRLVTVTKVSKVNVN